MTAKKIKDNNDKLVDIFIPDNEFDESKTLQINNLKKNKIS